MADPVLEGNNHLIEIDLLIIEVADSTTLEDLQPDRAYMEIVVSGGSGRSCSSSGS